MTNEVSVREEIEVAPVELPPVVPNWDELSVKADEMAMTIDKHLDYEGVYQCIVMTPSGLCPRQRAELSADLVGRQ